MDRDDYGRNRLRVSLGLVELPQTHLSPLFEVREVTKKEIAIWNAAVKACQERVYSDGVQLYPDLYIDLESLKK